LGEKKMLWTTSPMPLWLPVPGTTFCWLITGRMVREMRFQSLLRLTGITGWTLTSQRSPSSPGPMFSS